MNSETTISWPLNQTHNLSNNKKIIVLSNERAELRQETYILVQIT